MLNKAFTRNLDLWKSFPLFMKLELLLLIVMIIADTGVGILIVKLKGLVFNIALLAYIGIFATLFKILGQFLRNTPLHVKSFMLIILNILTAVILFFYGIMDIDIWLYALILLSSVYGIYSDSFYIDYDIIVKVITNNAMFKDINYFERILFIVAGVAGTSIVSGLTYIYNIEVTMTNTDSLIPILMFYSILYLVLAGIGFYQYRSIYSTTEPLHEKDKEGKKIPPEFIMTLDEYKKL